MNFCDTDVDVYFDTEDRKMLFVMKYYRKLDQTSFIVAAYADDVFTNVPVMYSYKP